MPKPTEYSKEKVSTYRIEFAKRVEKQLKKIPKKIRDLIWEKVDGLIKDSRPQGVETIKGAGSEILRVRQGDYRIIYQVQDDKLVVLIVRVVHRKEVYKKKHSKDD